MEPVTSWKRRATGAHDLSRRRRWEHLSRATSAMRKLGRVITRGMPSAAPFPRVLPQDPTAGRRLSITAVSPRGHRRTGHYGPLGVHPAGTDVLCCESGSASRWRFFLPGRVGGLGCLLLQRIITSSIRVESTKMTGMASAGPLASHHAATSFADEWLAGTRPRTNAPACVHSSRRSPSAQRRSRLLLLPWNRRSPWCHRRLTPTPHPPTTALMTSRFES